MGLERRLATRLISVDDRIPPARPSFLDGGGEMGALIHAHDWSATSLSTPEVWPASLRTLVGVLLMSQQPMFIVWGPERTFLYNDAFIPVAGYKHPAALGRPCREVWAEAWGELEPRYDRVFNGEAFYATGLVIGLDRHGAIEDAHFDYSYTPVRGENGAVQGLFGVCIETTDRVLTERRQTATIERERAAYLR